MTGADKKYHGKALLYGEYTIIDGGDALAIPLPHIFGVWKRGNFLSTSHDNLKAFYRYLISFPDLPLDFQRLYEDLGSGIYIESNAPRGYGVGSSGIVTAAIFDRYGRKGEKHTLEQLKQILSRMESHFHGSSSGLDPLVTLLNHPLWIRDGQIEILDGLEREILTHMHLVDTGISRQTAPFVQLYKDKMIASAYRQAIQDLGHKVKDAIEATYFGDKEQSLLSIRKISSIQYDYFKEMIPDPFEVWWIDGLESGDYYFKLCGAGGGGYLFVFQCDLQKPLPFQVIPII